MKCNSHSFAERLMRNDAHESEIKMKAKKKQKKQKQYSVACLDVVKWNRHKIEIYFYQEATATYTAIQT